MVRIEKANKMKGRNTNTVLFSLANNIISTLLMVGTYWIWLRPQENSVEKYGLIILCAIVTGFIGSWITRMLFGYYKQLIKQTNYYIRMLFIDLLYALIIILGFLTYVFENFGFWEILLIWLMLKLGLFLLCDFITDKITFGG